MIPKETMRLTCRSTGMLASAETVKIVARTLRERRESFDLVLDPVWNQCSAVVVFSLRSR